MTRMIRRLATVLLVAVGIGLSPAGPVTVARAECPAATSCATGPVECEVIRLAPYKYLIVIYIEDDDGDVYVLDVLFWDCPPYSGR